MVNRESPGPGAEDDSNEPDLVLALKRFVGQGSSRANVLEMTVSRKFCQEPGEL